MLFLMPANDPAIKLVGSSWFLPSRPALTEPQASVMGTNFIEHYECRAEGPDRAESERHGVQGF
jgi:hypothetical protein